MRYVLDFRERATGGAVVRGVLTGNSLDALRLESRIIFLIHGFNVNRADGLVSLSRLADALPSVASAGVVLVLWPGDHWAGPLSYSFEGRDADDTAAELEKFVRDEISLRTSLSFVAHSLGSRVTMAAANRVALAGFDVSQVCLMAPAIDDDSLADPRYYRFAASVTGRVALLWSQKDTVLKYAYPAGDLLQAFIFSEDTGLALGYHGPRAHDGQGIPSSVLHVGISDGRGVGHSHYIPGEAPDPRERANQAAATRFADAVMGGVSVPPYG